MKAPRTLLLAILATLCGCGPHVPEAPTVGGAWVRLPAVAGRPGAAYFTLSAGDAPVRLTAIESPRAERIELHESMGDMAGRMTMRPLDHVDVAAGAIATFAPAGRHAMLFGVAPGLKPGDTVPLAFRLADGRRIEAVARTLAAGDAAPH